MRKAVVFGLGKNYEYCKKSISSLYNVEVIALSDNDSNRHGETVDNVEVIAPENISTLDYDVVLITPVKYEAIVTQLRLIGISVDNIEILSHPGKFAEKISGFIDLKNKNILDVGCGNGNLLKFIADNYSPKYVTGIDHDLQWWNTSEESGGGGWNIKNGNAEALYFDNNSFDAIYSISTFEHINNIEKALSEIKRVLKPGGKFYAIAEAIWTSVIGHHFIVAKTNWLMEHLSLIPPWGHLYMSEHELRGHLVSQNISEVLLESIIERIYYSNVINRISRTDLIRDIVGSGMVIHHFNERVAFNRSIYNDKNESSELTEEVLEKIRKTDYRIDDLGVLGFEFVLEKYI